MSDEKQVCVVTDSSCDLPRETVKELGITIVPLIVRMGAEVYEDGELSMDEFWQKATGPYPPQTSQPSPGAFEEAFARLVARGKQVLCLSITSKHSGTFNSARLAAQRFGDAVHVFDSLSISLGLGVQAMVAAQAARAGQSMQEIVRRLENLRARIHLTILLDTLENLRRGGRADGFIAAVDHMTRVLNIKPLINMVDGQLRLAGAVRSFQGGLKRIAELVRQIDPLEHMAVVHTRREETAVEMADKLAEQTGFPRERVWVRETGAALASHGGRGVIGVLAVSAR